MRLRWLAALAASLALAGCGGPAAPSSPSAPAPAKAAPASASPAAAGEEPRVRMAASQNIVGNAPVWLTAQAKLFAQNGLNANLASVNATNAIKQLVAGQIDAFVGGSPEALTARAAGSPVTIVAVFQNKYDMLMTVPKDITAMSQLKGKTVGVISKPSVNGVATIAAMKKYGLQADKDYTILEAGSGAAYQTLAAALLGGKVSAAALQPDFARKAGPDFHVLFDLAKQPDLVTAGSTLTFQSSFVQQHPAEVQKTVDSFLQGMRYFRDHKEEAETLMRQTFKITDQTDLDEGYARQVELIASDPTPRPELYPDMVEAISQISPDVKKVDLSSLLDPRFAQDAVKRGLAG